MTPAYALTKLSGWLLLRLRYGLEVRGQHHVPGRGGCLIACNHVSFLDPVVLGVACPRPLRFMARADLYRHRWLAAYFRSVRVMPLRRGEADLSAVRAGLAVLARGEALGIFPEGTRQLSGALSRAKRGIAVLAVHARVPIIPALLHGTFQALPPKASRLHPSKIRVAFGPPIPYTTAFESSPSQPPRADHQRLADVVTTQWQRLAGELEG